MESLRDGTEQHKALHHPLRGHLHATQDIQGT